MVTSYEKMLIVDDDLNFRNRLARAFADRGFSVEMADSYEGAKLNFSKTRFMKAIIDLRMPGSSGLSVVKELCSAQPDCRVLMLTGYGSIATATEAIKFGAANYLCKPATATEILAALALEEPPVTSSTSDLSAKKLERVEWEHINQVLLESGNNISRAAVVLGLPRRTLQRKLGKFPNLRRI